MTSSPKELGALLDAWTDAELIRVLEAGGSVSVSSLDAAAARELCEALSALNWEAQIEDAAHQPTSIDELEDDFGPFNIIFAKLVESADRCFITKNGFRGYLPELTGGLWQLAFCEEPFSTGLVSFHPWGHGDIFSPSLETKSPLEIVRESRESRLVSPDIRRWLLRGVISDAQWQDAAFQIFASVSAPHLIRSLASEVTADGVVFNGPPRLNLELRQHVLAALGREGYADLQAAVAWVYEDKGTAEQRHALFASEAARSIQREDGVGVSLAKVGKDLLEGARFAFQLSQSELSRESIKTQGDLRKSIADDTNKAAENTRTLAGAVAAAIATGIGLVVARSTSTASPHILATLSGVVGLYILALSLTGWMHLFLQQSLREQWRRRFYRFVPEEDYKAMVLDPAKQSEMPYHIMGVVAVIVATGLLCLAMTGFNSVMR